MTAIPFLVKNEYPWLELIAASGEEGAHWAAQYSQPEVDGLYTTTTGSLRLMVLGKLEEALAVLNGVKAKIDALPESYPPSISQVLECWYRGALAYYHYVREDFSAAEATLLAGHAAITRGIEMQPVILPMVYRCCDTWLHRSRIARSRRDWTAMKGHLETFCAIHRGDEPFCTLSDGKGLYFSDLDRYFENVEATEELARYREVFCVGRNREAYSNYYAEAIYLIPWLPIHY